MNSEYPDVDFAFHHHLYDTLILLGCKVEIARMLKKRMDGIAESDVDAVRNYNISLMDAAKGRIVNCNHIKIRTAPED